MLDDEDEEVSALYDPRSSNTKPKLLAPDQVPVKAKRAIGIHDPKTGEYIPPSDKTDRNIGVLRDLLAAAIKGNMITTQQIREEIGPKALDVLKGKNPSPDIHRALITCLAALSPPLPSPDP